MRDTRGLLAVSLLAFGCASVGGSSEKGEVIRRIVASTV